MSRQLPFNPGPLAHVVCIPLMLIVLLAAMVSSTAVAETLSLDLDEAIAIAMRDNITVQNAYLSRISQKYAYRVAQNEFELQYNLTGLYGRDSFYADDGRDDTDFGQVALGSSLRIASGGVVSLMYSQDVRQQNELDSQHDGAVTLRFTQPLMRGFGRRIATANLTQAEIGDLSSQLGLKSALIGTVTTVIRQYRSLVLARNSLEIARLSLDRFQQQLETSRELVRSGRMASVELVQSETAVANQQLTVRIAENTVDTERLNLLLLLRLPEYLEIEPTEVIEVKPTQTEFDELLATAETNQPDYLRARLDLRSAHLAFDVNQDNQRWDLDFVSSYRLAGQGANVSDVYSGLGPFDQGDYSLQLVLNVPIGDYGRKQGLVSSEVGWYQARNSLITTEENLRLTLRRAQQDIQTAWDSLGLAEAALTLSQRQLDVEIDKQRAGKSTSFQVVAYENDLANAQNRHVSAQIAYLNALTSLDQILGVTLDRWGLQMVSEAELLPQNIPDYYAGEGRAQ